MNAMIDQDMLDDLSRLYRLCPLAPEGFPSLHRSLKGSIQQRGTELNRVSMEMRELGDLSTRGKVYTRSQNANAHGIAQAFQWVEDVLKLKAKFDRMWEASFKKDHKIGSVLDEVIVIDTIYRGGWD
jgi:cullin 3